MGKIEALRELVHPSEITPEDVDQEYSRIASNPIQESVFLQEELTFMQELQAIDGDTRPIEELALEAANRNAEAGNVQATRELLYKGSQDIGERFRVIHRAQKNFVQDLSQGDLDSRLRATTAKRELNVLVEARKQYIYGFQTGEVEMEVDEVVHPTRQREEQYMVSGKVFDLQPAYGDD